MNQDELRAASERLRSFNFGALGTDHCNSTTEDAIELICKAYLAEHPADDNEPATPEWWENVRPEGECRIDVLLIEINTYLDYDDKCIAKNPTRRQVRCLAEACGLVLR